mgnify:CR=1 FL=1
MADHESIEASLGAFETRATQSPWRAQYEALISEAFLDEFCANYVFDYSLAAYDGGYLVEAGDVALQETSSAEDPARRVYSYTLPLTVTLPGCDRLLPLPVMTITWWRSWRQTAS